MNKVLVIAEHDQKNPLSSTKTTINAASQITPDVDVLVATADATVANEVAMLKGVKRVLLAQDPCFLHILAEEITPLIIALAKEYTHILAPATTFGKNFLPQVAALLDVAQISDVTHIDSADTFIRPIYAGNAFEKVRSKDAIKVMTVRTTAFESVTQAESTVAIVPLTITIKKSEKIQFKSQHTPPSTRPELTDARIIVSGGRGLKNAENFQLLEKLADLLGAAMGASRAAVDAGWVANDLQVGQTGKVVAPELYIAVGISGAIQHLAGMKESKVIVAINSDPEAPIFQIADYGLVGDSIAILSEWIAILEEPRTT